MKGRNIAISEWPTNSAFYKNGYVDYAFFIGEKLVALMDAKKASEDVASTIDVPVSYTHLDVYKRQVVFYPCPVKRRRRARFFQKVVAQSYPIRIII